MILCKFKTTDLSVLDELEDCVQQCHCCKENVSFEYIYLTIENYDLSLTAHVYYPGDIELIFNDKQKFVNYCKNINHVLDIAKNNNPNYICTIRSLKKVIESM